MSMKRIQEIDSEIASLQKAFKSLQAEKVKVLKAELAAASSGLGEVSTPAATTSAPAPARKKRAYNKKSSAAKKAAPGAKRGRKRANADEALIAIRKVVTDAGSKGVSAREASIRVGVSYPLATRLLKENFKRHGTGKDTSYTVS
jgi:hypothetical protein